MKSGKKPDDNGSKKIHLTINSNGTVLWEQDISQLTHSRSTMTFQEVVIPLDEQLLAISIQCVPNITILKDQKASKNLELGSNDKKILKEFYDAIFEVDKK